MHKLFLITLLIAICPFGSCLPRKIISQTNELTFDINGVYKSFKGQIIIQDSLLYYIQDFSWTPSKQTVKSNCTFRRVTNDFIEVTSFRSDFDIAESTILNYTDYNDADSTSVKLFVPTKRALQLSVYLTAHHQTVFQKTLLMKGECEFKLPRISGPFNMDITIMPLYSDFMWMDTGRGLPYATVCIDKIMPENNIIIEIPPITDDYFARIIFLGEYLRVYPDSIICNKTVYKKQKP